MRAIDAIRKRPVSIPADWTILEAARRMNEASVGAVVVIDGDEPVGIVTDRDLVIRALAHDLPKDARVDAVMSSDLVTLPASSDVREAFKIFHSLPLRRIPIVEDGKLVGMVTADDLLIDLVGDLAALSRPITGQVIWGAPERIDVPAPVEGSTNGD
jgi:signal-transduction protein with cAMP-binding, CBS, and nucleotidyltransferase domain